MNERKTENYVRQRLIELGYYQNPDIIVEEQKSDNPRIKKLLSKASKRGIGQGFPEFIISSKVHSNFLIVIECKADPTKHASTTGDKFSEYAVDGVLLYASYLVAEYNVIAIAVSGETEKDIRVSNFLCLKESIKPKPLDINKILSFENYYELFENDINKRKQDYDSLLDFAQELNQILHEQKVKESQRSLLISGILIALQSSLFKSGYKHSTTAKELGNSLLTSIETVLKNSNIPNINQTVLKNAFAFLGTHPILSTDKDFMIYLIDMIDERINSLLKSSLQYLDAIGQFYIEFLRYANNDKGLGIVLTPPHITELFVELAGVNENSVVLDNCCGTGGFLLSAMKKMIYEAGGDKEKELEIKTKQLVGIELQDDIFTLAVSNMIIHGDGKTNIYHGNCFDENLMSIIKEEYKPTVGLLNPPYNTGVKELEFVLNNLAMLQQGGKCVAIVPMSCVTATTGDNLILKQKIMEQHTLEAVMSMPDDLFYNSKVKVNTVILVITAHIPHPRNKKVWLGYWKDDGFVMLKHWGRVDRYNRWEQIKRDWVEAFINREVRENFSLMVNLTPNDEWCIEAYMDTDYSQLKEEDFINTIKQYVAFKFLNSDLFEE